MNAASTRPGARAVAVAALVLGLGCSIAANIGHAYVCASAPSVGAVVASVVWPVLVLVAVELLTRIPWPAGRAWALVRWAGVGLVAVVAALVSYRHMAGLLAAYGEDPVVAAVGPLAIDGLAVMATAALIALGGPTPTPAPVDASTVEIDAPDAFPDAPAVEVDGDDVPVWAPVPAYDDVAMDVSAPAPVLTMAAVEADDADDVPSSEPVEVAPEGAPAYVWAPRPAGRVVTARMLELAPRVADAIREGELAPAPSEAQVRAYLGGGGAETVRGVRDMVAEITADPIPGQTRLHLAGDALTDPDSDRDGAAVDAA
ncbi:hypothetical protein QK900_15665 (plasmid) [Arsenicicoccus dermatophilus]|uniref:DUF2637 domain-containing protein n=1 Tax=Arsenicicoccus dermatophilus TaxID=1076331 RepID=UPI00389191EC